jgi:hypothetical protein
VCNSISEVVPLYVERHPVLISKDRRIEQTDFGVQ